MKPSSRDSQNENYGSFSFLWIPASILAVATALRLVISLVEASQEGEPIWHSPEFQGIVGGAIGSGIVVGSLVLVVGVVQALMQRRLLQRYPGSLIWQGVLQAQSTSYALEMLGAKSKKNGRYPNPLALILNEGDLQLVSQTGKHAFLELPGGRIEQIQIRRDTLRTGHRGWCCVFHVIEKGNTTELVIHFTRAKSMWLFSEGRAGTRRVADQIASSIGLGTST